MPPTVQDEQHAFLQHFCDPIQGPFSPETETPPRIQPDHVHDDPATLPTPRSSKSTAPTLARRDPPKGYNAVDVTAWEDPGPLDGVAYHAKRWYARWLALSTLISLVVMFLAFVIALLLLWRFDKTNNGLALNTSFRYVWAYGPTAVLVVVVSLWRQIDYWCKKLAPWDELKKHDAIASKSLLLDYISPIQLISLWRACKNRHVAVVASILGFTVLKLLTVASTGLFVEIPTHITSTNTTLAAATTFNSSTYRTQSPAVGADGIADLDPSVAYLVYGILHQGMPYPAGTKKGVAYETFGFPVDNQHMNASVSAVVKAFYPTSACEPVEVRLQLPRANDTNGWAAYGGENGTDATMAPYSLTAPESPWCNRNFGDSYPPSYHPPYLNGYGLEIPCNPVAEEDCSGREYIFQTSLIDCSATDQRDLLTLIDWRFINNTTPQTAASDVEHTMINGSTVYVERITALLCQWDYRIEKTTLTYQYGRGEPLAVLGNPLISTKASLDGFTVANLTNELLLALEGVDGAFWSDDFHDPGFDSWTLSDSTLLALMSAVNGTGSMSLFNETVMAEAAQTVFENVAVQIARKAFVQTSGLPFHGQVSFTQNRLHVRELSVWLMVAGFTILAALNVIVIFYRPQGAVCVDPDSLAAIATVTRNSEALKRIMQGTGAMASRELCEQLQAYRYSSFLEGPHTHPNDLRIEVGQRDRIRSPGMSTGTMADWCRPFVTSRVTAGLVLCLPLVVISVLEVLQWLSDRTAGVADLTNVPGVVSDIYTRFLPSLLTLCIATLYNQLDFTFYSFAPFTALRSGGLAAKRAMTSSIGGRLPLHALLTCLRNSFWGAVCTGIAAFIGSVLTIVVSRLYIVQELPVTRSVKLTRIDYFNTDWQNSSFNDNAAAAVLTLIEGESLDYPAFTYGDFAYPNMQLANTTFLDSSLITDRVPIKARVPGIRASLNCTHVPQSGQTIVDRPKVPSTAMYQWFKELSVNAPLPEKCRPAGVAGNHSWTMGFVYNGTEAYVGRILDLHVQKPNQIGIGANNDEFPGYVDEEGVPGDYNDNAPGCPSFAFTFGRITHNDDSELTSMVCYQLLEEVQTNVVFNLPDLEISAESPPVPDEALATLLHSSNNGDTAFEFRPGYHLADEFRMIGSNLPPDLRDARTRIDPFFQDILYGRYPHDPAKLTGENSTQELFEAVQGLYRRYMAQAISLNMRESLNSTEAKAFTGSLQNPQDTRMIMYQNKATKTALQAMLAAMVAYGALAYAVTRIRNLLPHDPYSVAGIASLFADSEMCNGGRMGGLIPEQDSEIGYKEDMVWDDLRFRLGWWESKGMEQRRYGIDVVQPGMPMEEPSSSTMPKFWGRPYRAYRWLLNR